MVINEEAFTAGAVPVPDVDITVSWHYWYSSSQGAMQADRTIQVPFDIRTARKVRGDQRYVLVVKNSVASAATLQLSIPMRLLWRHL